MATIEISKRTHDYILLTKEVQGLWDKIESITVTHEPKETNAFSRFEPILLQLCELVDEKLKESITDNLNTINRLCI